MTHTRGRPARRAFSLIELLVVIAIIALILGITIPTLSIARAKAASTACGAKLYGIGQAITIYRENNEGKHPEARYMPDPWLTGDTRQPINEALRDYMEPYSTAWVCPADRVVHSQTYDDNGTEKTCGVSYSYVTLLSAQAYEETFFARWLRFTPSDTPVMHDFDGGTFEREDGQTVRVDFFHPRRNILFVDGHVGHADSTNTRND